MQNLCIITFKLITVVVFLINIAYQFFSEYWSHFWLKHYVEYDSNIAIYSSLTAIDAQNELDLGHA